MKLIALVSIMPGANAQALSPGAEFDVKNNEDAQSLIARGFAKAAPAAVKTDSSKAEQAAAEQAAKGV